MIWILLPAYNEEDSLPKLLPKIKNAFEQKKEEFRLVIVNDGSVDSTSSILDKFHQDKSYNLTVVTHKINRGLGETERDGFEYIASVCNREDVIVRVEGDDTHDPKYIFSLIEKLNGGFDVVNTSRFQPDGGQLGLNTYRKTISRLANWFMAFMFGIKGVKDYSCGFRAYKASVIQDGIIIFGNNFLQLKGLGFTSTLELIVKLNILGCKFAEVPFVLRYDLKESESKMVGSITTIGYFMMAFLYHWPWGGWKKSYKNLRKDYPIDQISTANNHRKSGAKIKSASKISI